MLGHEEGRYLAEHRADRLGAVSVGTSCIRLKRLEGVDADELRALITESARQWRSGELGTTEA